MVRNYLVFLWLFSVGLYALFLFNDTLMLLVFAQCWKSQSRHVAFHKSPPLLPRHLMGLTECNTQQISDYCQSNERLAFIYYRCQWRNHGIKTSQYSKCPTACFSWVGIELALVQFWVIETSMQIAMEYKAGVSSSKATTYFSKATSSVPELKTKTECYGRRIIIILTKIYR